MSPSSYPPPQPAAELGDDPVRPLEKMRRIDLVIRGRGTVRRHVGDPEMHDLFGIPLDDMEQGVGQEVGPLPPRLASHRPGKGIGDGPGIGHLPDVGFDRPAVGREGQLRQGVQRKIAGLRRIAPRRRRSPPGLHLEGHDDQVAVIAAADGVHVHEAGDPSHDPGLFSELPERGVLNALPDLREADGETPALPVGPVPPPDQEKPSVRHHEGGYDGQGVVVKKTHAGGAEIPQHPLFACPAHRLSAVRAVVSRCLRHTGA